MGGAPPGRDGPGERYADLHPGLGPDGSRIATRDGTTTAYLVPDPHGNLAATETASTAIANAIRRLQAGPRP